MFRSRDEFIQINPNILNEIDLKIDIDRETYESGSFVSMANISAAPSNSSSSICFALSAGVNSATCCCFCRAAFSFASRSAIFAANPFFFPLAGAATGAENAVTLGQSFIGLPLGK